MSNLTERQKEILRFIENFINERGYSPTVREIANRFSITSKGAQDHIFALYKKGYIEKENKIPRTIRLTAKNKAVEA